MELEIRRQLIHMSGAITPLYLQYAYERFSSWLAPVAVLVFLIISTVAVSVAYRKGVRVPVLSRIIESAERPQVIEEEPGRGTLRFFAGVLATVVLFGMLLNAPFCVSAAGMLVLALGDSVSTLAGVKLGRHRLPHNRRKSAEGTALGAGAAFAGVLAYMLAQGASVQFSAALALASAASGMLVESLPLKIDDNLTVPLAGAAGAYAVMLMG